MRYAIDLKLIGPAQCMPEYGSQGAAGVDLRANLASPIALRPGEKALIGTGVAVHIKNRQLAGFIYPRSGLGFNSGLVLGNGVGVIDSDYQGELKVAAWNRNLPGAQHDEDHLSDNFDCMGVITINPFDRIAQLVFQQVAQVRFEIIPDFDANEIRSVEGFGSTGVI